MNSIKKNIVIVLGMLTIAFAGYYFYVQNSYSDEALETASSEMLVNTQVFITRSQELDSMSFDLSVLENERFLTTRTFTKPVESQPTGRTNPFAEIGSQ